MTVLAGDPESPHDGRGAEVEEDPQGDHLPPAPQQSAEHGRRRRVDAARPGIRRVVLIVAVAPTPLRDTGVERRCEHRC
ncbi:hypothetical protein ABZ656_40195 [Streptomyces sp. NPDC007095]|uniref:hypothetical protein n=1 Tax=Streptomyces sp. NPDC007095 TaxID=3154482 RepID=UPI0033D1E734